MELLGKVKVWLTTHLCSLKVFFCNKRYLRVIRKVVSDQKTVGQCQACPHRGHHGPGQGITHEILVIILKRYLKHTLMVNNK